MASIAEQVFALPELLEIILSHLSQKELLLSQRINTTFRDTIRYSSRLQKALFFQPDWKLEARAFNAYARLNRPGQKPENNRLLLRAFPGCYPTVTLVITSSNGNVVTAMPPALVEEAEAEEDEGEEFQKREKGRTSEQWSWDVCISFPADATPGCNAAVHYPEASWRRMYLCQPPCTTLYLVRRWQRSINPAIVRETGITMDAFVGETTKIQPGWHRSYISSDRDWHFEGNIKCSSVRDAPTEASSYKCADFSYIHWKSLAQGVLQIMSDDWNPSQVVGVGAALTAAIH